jgi:chemotaxis protein methyltransferase CheR
MSTSVAREREFTFTDADFNSLRQLVREVSGITLADSKRELVYGRLSRRLRHLNMDSFGDYRALLASEDGKEEMGEFTNAVTTNLTSFFRESHHFDYLRDHFLAPRVAKPGASRRIRIWCAASSTGEEPYSIAMTVAETIPDWERWDIRILATDLDTQVLEACEAATYREERIKSIPRARLERHFDRVSAGAETVYRIKPALTRMISFRQLNLMQRLPIKGPLDVIFCRNVIIYFDKDTQRDLFSRIAPLQRAGDLLFLGHSESLFKVSDAWALIGKTVYRKTP